MTDRVQWRVDPMVARGFGPHQVMVYIASVYVSGRCLDSVACASRRDAHALALDMARAAQFALSDESHAHAEVRQ